MASRHIARIAIGYEMLVEMLTAGWTSRPGWIECIRGLPEGAEFVYSYFDERTQLCWLGFSHPSFEPVELGAEVPIIQPLFRRHNEE
jgi:hypothetical protein